MAARRIVPGLYALRLGMVNAFLLETDDSLALIDTGYAASAEAILGGVRQIGRQAQDLRHILVTHCHPDHAGSLAALKQKTGATAYMHPADAAMVRAGETRRPMSAGPGILNALVFQILVRTAPRSIEAAEIEWEVDDGDELAIAGGMRAIHVPGHCAGQLAFLWPRHGGVLFAADACANPFRLSLSPAYEDLAEGRRSLAKLAALEFEVACFGHGRPILRGAAQKFRAKWAREAF
jgi:glyoxylase-like metal-dependent hydrolase (beta-lactamase superfamily II)